MAFEIESQSACCTAALSRLLSLQTRYDLRQAAAATRGDIQGTSLSLLRETSCDAALHGLLTCYSASSSASFVEASHVFMLTSHFWAQAGKAAENKLLGLRGISFSLSVIGITVHIPLNLLPLII